MADKSAIEWTEATWNPIVGCSIVSPGCTNCYAMKMAARIEKMGTAPHYDGLTKGSKGGAVWTGKLALAPDHILTQPLRWKRPRVIFVNSMGDLFHEDVPDEAIDRVFAVMALTPQHTYQVLTKRGDRMRAYLSERFRPSFICARALSMVPARDAEKSPAWNMPWPLPNVWLGVSAEDQKRADERIPDLLATPAAVRFLSGEPLLGPLDLNLIHYEFDGGLGHAWESALNGKRFDMWSGGDIGGMPSLDWVIVGGESGPGARPMHPEWARQIRDACTAAGVAFFMKQWGSWLPGYYSISRHTMLLDPAAGPDHGMTLGKPPHKPSYVHEWNDGSGLISANVGKKAAGALLDGREWRQMPTTSKEAA